MISSVLWKGLKVFQTQILGASVLPRKKGIPGGRAWAPSEVVIMTGGSPDPSD